MTDVLMQTKFATLFVYYSFAQKLIRQEQKLLKKLLKKLKVLVRKPCKRGRKKEGKHLKVLSPELLQKYSAREKRRSDCVRWRKPCPRLKCLELSYTLFLCVLFHILCFLGLSYGMTMWKNEMNFLFIRKDPRLLAVFLTDIDKIRLAPVWF